MHQDFIGTDALHIQLNIPGIGYFLLANIMIS